MAFLKDTVVAGDLRVTDTIYGDVPLADLVDADDLKAIEALTGTSGTLTKTGTNTWALSSGVTPASHTHGNLTNDGKVGSDANKAIYTTTGGAITAGTLPVAAGGTGQTSIANIQAGKDGDGNTIATFYTPLSYMPYRSTRNFTNGTLITTDLNGGTTSSSIPFLLKIVGNGYGDGIVHVYCQGYVYQLGNGYNNYISTDAYSTSSSFANKIYAFKNTAGKLCFWFERIAYWQGFDAQCWDCSENTNTKKTVNHVTSITDSAYPDEANRQYATEISVKHSLNTSNYTTYTVKKDGTGASGTWGISISGNAATATSATKATQDSDGNAINTTYIKKSTLSGAYDVMYSSAANTPTRLAANTTTTKKFLRMTGTGSAGTAPVWDTVTKADVGLGNVANTTITVTSNSVSDGTTTFNKYTHPTTSGNKHIPSGGSSGQFLGWDSDGTAKWVNNPNTNTDTKVTQSDTNTDNWRKVLVGYQSSATSGAAVTTQTEQAYVSNKFEFQSSTGTLKTTKYVVNDAVTLEYNTTTKSLDFIFA